MALVPNHWTETSIEIPFSDQDEWTEVLKTLTIHSGFYKAPGQGASNARSSSGDDSILLEQTKSIMNQFGTEIRRDEEEWNYEIAGGPPLAYSRITKSNIYLPGLGSQFRTVEEEETDYFTFSPLTDGDNLGRIRRISAYVVYTLPVDPKKPASDESKENAKDAGVTEGTTEDRLVATGKIWSEATHDSTIVRDVAAPQWAKWINNVIEEHDVVEEQTDRWIIWTVIKNALRPGDVQIRGPRDVKKTFFQYKFPFPIDPPKISLHNVAGGIKIEVEGGGAYWRTTYFRQEVDISADKYNIYRMKVTEPDRDADSNLYDWWDTPPDVEAQRQIIVNTDVTDFDGGAASAIPAPTSYTEPHSVDPPDEGTETVFALIATIDNVNIERRHDQGYGEHIDEDIVASAEYEYYATAIIADSESPDSNHERITAGDDGHARLTIRSFDNGRGADAVAPDDPDNPDTDYGETEEVEIPTDDIDDVIEDIAQRQFASNDPDYQVTMDVLKPLLGLEYGQVVQTPVVGWDTYGNELHLQTETESDEWVLTGFTIKVEKNKDGSWKTQHTTLSMQERSS